MSEKEIVAKNFQRLREERSLTQEQLAAIHKVSQNYIAQIEGMHCDFGARARKKWAKFFGVSISEFFRNPPASSASHSLESELEQEISLLRSQAI